MNAARKSLPQLTTTSTPNIISTGAGPFGGCVPVQMAGGAAGNGTAAAAAPKKKTTRRSAKFLA